MNYEELRPLTLQFLKKYRQTNLTVRALIAKVESLAVDRGFYKDTVSASHFAGSRPQIMPAEDREKIRQVINDLLVEGVLGWGNEEYPDPPVLSLSEYGKQVVKSDAAQPYDPDGFLAYLKSQVPNIDDIILTYITEALQTFRRNNLLSAAVMTGVASERVFDLLLEAVTEAVTGPGQQEKFEKLQNDTRTKNKFDEVKKVIVQARAKLPQEINETLDSDLDGIFNLIRVARNDAGHPTGKTVRREQVFVNLQLFVPYCKCVYGLINFLKNNHI